MKIKESMIQSRSAVIQMSRDAEGAAVVSAALSSEEPAMRSYGREILLHTDDAIDMSRAVKGLPLTVNHSEMDRTSPRLPVGRITNISLDQDKKLRGILAFDTDAEGQAVAGKVERGIAPDISLTYRILDYKGPDKSGDVKVTRWMPMAGSIVTSPEDATVGVGRGIETQEAPIVDKPVDAAQTGAASIIDEVKARNSDIAKIGAKGERDRVKGIMDVAASVRGRAPEIDTLAIKCVEDGVDLQAFRSYALDLIGSGEPLSAPPDEAEPRFSPQMPESSRRGIPGPNQQNLDVQARGMELAMLEQMGPAYVKPEDMQGNQFRGWSQLNIAEHCLRNHGFDTRGKSYEQIAKMAIQMRAISPGTAAYDTTDFPAMTANIGFKALFDGFMAAERTWDRWCNVGSTPDFKAFDVPRISATSILPTVAENAAYQNLTRVDAKETGQALKKGGLISYSWEAIVNNDVNSFADQAASSGEAAMATVDEGVYADLLSNAGAGPTMGDTNFLFDAINHDNQGTAALDLAGIVATRVAMGRQTDDNARKLGIRLAHVLVPLELEDAAINLAGSEWLVDVSDTAQRMNTVRNTFTPIATHLLTDVNDWYGLARSGQTYRVFFLNGQQSPTIEQESGWDTDAMHWKVRIVFDQVAQDWRGMYRNVVT